MIEFYNPIEDVFKAVENLYGEQTCEVRFETQDRINGKEKKGCTCFHSDGSTPIISLSVELPLGGVLDVLSHEMAHLVLGPDVKEHHGEQWEQTYNAIYEEYCRLVQERFEQHGGRTPQLVMLEEPEADDLPVELAKPLTVADILKAFEVCEPTDEVLIEFIEELDEEGGAASVNYAAVSEVYIPNHSQNIVMLRIMGDQE